MPVLPRLVFIFAILIQLSFVPDAYSQSTHTRTLTIAPRATLSISNQNVTFTIKDTNKGLKDYFIIIKYLDTKRLFARKKITANRGKGVLTVRSIPIGTFTYYTDIVITGNSPRRSGVSRFHGYCRYFYPNSDFYRDSNGNSEPNSSCNF